MWNKVWKQKYKSDIASNTNTSLITNKIQSGATNTKENCSSEKKQSFSPGAILRNPYQLKMAPAEICKNKAFYS